MAACPQTKRAPEGSNRKKIPCNELLVYGDGGYQCPFHGPVDLAKFSSFDLEGNCFEGLKRFSESDAQLAPELVGVM